MRNVGLIKELATKESALQATAVEAKVEVGGVAIVKRDFGEVIDVNRMVQTATKP